MQRWPFWPSVVLICLLTLWQEAETAFTIDWVKLDLLPGATVNSGTNLTLHCEAKVYHSSSQLVQTFRFLQNNEVIYSQETSEAVVERSLVPARASNSGSYKCQVQIEKRKKDSQTLSLTVTGLQTPQLKVHPRFVNEGDEITATCGAPEETGSLSFHFFLNNQELNTQDSKNNSVTIVIKPDQRGKIQLHCNYRLSLHPSTVSSNNSNNVEIHVQELNITPSIRILPNADVVEGDRVHISCNVSGYQRDLNVFLFANTLLHEDSTSFTHSFQVTANDSGRYTCKAEKNNVEKSSTTWLAVEELFSAPVLKITPEQVFEGQNFHLNCMSYDISKKRINNTDVRYTLFKGQHLLKRSSIYNSVANKASSGNYTCTAEAKGIRKTSMSLLLNVKVPVSVPVIRTVGPVIIGQPFQLICESQHGTLPIHYTLLKSHHPVAHTTVTGPLRNALFNISSIRYRNESQSFSCRAQNQGPLYNKSSQALSTQEIETVSIPELTLDIKGYMATENTDLRLYCCVHQGTVPITFTWYRIGDSAPLFTTRISKTKEMYTINSITSNHKGRYYCEASNDANVTWQSLPVTIGVNWAIWKKALIGVACIFLLVLIIAILVMFLKKARGPRKQNRAVQVSVKSGHHKSDDPMRISLTLDIEDNAAVNATPCIMGRNVWSENVSSSESEDESIKDEKMQPYSDSPPMQDVDTNTKEVSQSHQDELPEAPVVHDTDTEKHEVQECTQGSADQVDPALEYVQLNHTKVESA
ncbi:platelet endothelial cell adhesion molecule isoform X2 [Trichomycterus rosablanca]|uniref:platelet endothelial cell adhesion molecule isoform X2 n=1 Tax=Trichomycterus rosablanca TaxID=2290929 RepID=UPI002F356956